MRDCMLWQRAVPSISITTKRTLAILVRTQPDRGASSPKSANRAFRCAWIAGGPTILDGHKCRARAGKDTPSQSCWLRSSPS